MTDPSLDPDTLRKMSFPDALWALGDFHDCTVTSADWKPSTGVLQLQIEDLFWNFERFPEYPGALPGSIELTGVPSETRLDGYFVLPMMFYGVTAVAVSEGYEVTFEADVGRSGNYQKIVIPCRDARIIFGEDARRWSRVRKSLQRLLAKRRQRALG